MKLSCAFAPGPDTPEHIAAAEGLGYAGAWCNDSPALYHDVWMTLALAAERTTSIGLGIAVSVPSLRHVMTTASSVLALERRAGGRVRVAFGTGLTGRLTLGQPPMRWADVEAYVVALRVLLSGGTCEWDGATVGMLQGPDRVPSSLGAVELWIAADGPKGFEVADRSGDGVFSTGRPQADAHAVDSRALLVFGTVLQAGETLQSDRVRAAAGPAVAAAFHALDRRRETLARLPGGAAWLEAAGQPDQSTRHLEIHRGHLERLNEIDRAAWPDAGGLIPKMSITGVPEHVRERVAELEKAGITELVYQPSGPDVSAELAAMAEVLHLEQPEGTA